MLYRPSPPLPSPPGYWIAHMAIKLVYDSEDGLAPAPYDITTVKTAIYEFFEVS